MTAKRRGGGLLARLQDLEAVEAQRAEEVRAANWATMKAARDRLSQEDRAAFKDAQVMHGEDLSADCEAFLSRVARAVAHVPDIPVTHPAKAEADAWEALPGEGEPMRPLRPPPAGRAADFCAYFEACALWCQEEARRVPLSPDVQRLARWGAAVWRWEAHLCRILAGQMPEGQA